MSRLVERRRAQPCARQSPTMPRSLRALVAGASLVFSSASEVTDARPRVRVVAAGACDVRDDGNASASVALLLWHGMGDACDAEGVVTVLESMTSRIGAERACARSIGFGDTTKADRLASYAGDARAQTAAVCDFLRGDAVVRRAGGFHAIGFSQGGQFMRAVVQSCGKELGAKTLVTLGGQHAGGDSIPGCGGDVVSVACRAMNAAASAASASDWARHRVIQAQYFRDTSTHARYQRYLETNAFLPRINNEGQANEDASNREGLTSLERFVMFMFEDDDMVNPKESSWFGSRVIGGANHSQIVPYYQNEGFYSTLGLDALDREGKIETRLIPGARHMQFEVDWFVREIVEKYYM